MRDPKLRHVGGRKKDKELAELLGQSGYVSKWKPFNPNFEASPAYLCWTLMFYALNLWLEMENAGSVKFSILVSILFALTAVLHAAASHTIHPFHIIHTVSLARFKCLLYNSASEFGRLVWLPQYILRRPTSLHFIYVISFYSNSYIISKLNYLKHKQDLMNRHPDFTHLEIKLNSVFFESCVCELIIVNLNEQEFLWNVIFDFSIPLLALGAYEFCKIYVLAKFKSAIWYYLHLTFFSCVK